jgi:hypothetical protein
MWCLVPVRDGYLGTRMNPTDLTPTGRSEPGNDEPLFSAVGGDHPLPEHLLAAAGPQWLERPIGAGVPSAVSREVVYLQTLRARGELTDLWIETEWAQARFPRLDADGPPVAAAGTGQVEYDQ